MYQPSQGDIIMLDFGPQAGREQQGRRPALVVSNAEFNKRTKMAIVCPITSKISGFPTHLQLDNRTDTIGAIMCDQIKCLDTTIRNATFKEMIPSDILDDAIDLIGSFMD